MLSLILFKMFLYSITSFFFFFFYTLKATKIRALWHAQIIITWHVNYVTLSRIFICRDIFVPTFLLQTDPWNEIFMNIFMKLDDARFVCKFKKERGRGKEELNFIYHNGHSIFTHGSCNRLIQSTMKLRLDRRREYFHLNRIGYTISSKSPLIPLLRARARYF